MTKIIKSRGFLLLVIIVLASISIRSCYQSNQEIKEITRNNEILNEKVEKWQDESGKWRAKARTATGTIETLRVTHQNRLDSIVKEYKIKISDLKQSTSIGTQTDIDVSIPLESISEPVVMQGETYDSTLEKVESLSDRPFRTSNKWYDIRGVVKQNSVDLKINVFDSLSVITYWERDKFFKPKELKVQATSYNPYTSINYIENIEVSENKPSRFGIVVYGGIGLGNSLNFQPNIGIGIGYTLWQF